MAALDVPLIDLSQTGAAAAVGAACERIGFLIVRSHGVDPAVIAAASTTARAFFDRPLEEKLGYRPTPGVMRGYARMGGESVSYSMGAKAPPDLNESFAIGPLDSPTDPYFTGPAAGTHFAPNIWPTEPRDLRPAWSAYYRAMQGLAAELMRLFALALGLDERFFDDKIDRHISRLRVRNYPDQPTPALPGQLRAGAHTDHGSLTILCTADRPGGLQVRDAAGAWHDVPSIPGTFVVNIGDLMARWTNDRWVSTVHRVVNPPPDRAADSRRQSLVFFHNPNYDAEIVCLPTCLAPGAVPKYAPTTSGEHLRRQFLSMQIAAD